MLNLEESYKIEKAIIMFMGYYPKLKRTLLDKCKFWTVTIMSTLLTIPMVIELFEVASLDNLITVVYILITMAAYLYKLMNFFLNGHKFIDIEIYILQNRIENNDINVNLIQHFLKTYVRKAYMAVCLCSGSAFTISSIFAKRDQHELPYPGNYLIDKYKYYHEICVFQIIAMYISIVMNCTLDSLAAACISLVTIQCERLRRNLESIMNSKDQTFIKSQIKQNVIYHNQIIKFSVLVEGTFSNGIFVQFLASILVLCTSGFRLLMVS